ncbi:MAG: aminopeptidase P family protein [Anaerolineales bacterium]|nr:aminopeptidase P family protein [Anaerolineales bacterium]
MNTLTQEKITQAIEILNELDIDLWLTFVRETTMAPDPALELISGLDFTWKSAFLLGRDGAKVAVVGRFDGANVEAQGLYDEVIGYDEGIGGPLREAVSRLNPRQIAINYSAADVAADGLSHGMYQALLAIFADTPYADRFISAERVIAALRGRKSPAEVERMRAAVRETEKLFDEVEAFVRPGMTQREIAAFVHERIEARGMGYAWPKPFNPIVTCGPHSAVGHAAPGDVALEAGHLLHMDLGVKLDDYCSDLQRMWYVLAEGETEAPPDVQRAFAVVKGAIIAGEGALKVGVPAWQVDEVARDFIVDNGYPEYMHAFGHLLGRTAHDGATVLGPRWERYAGVCDLPVEVGNVFTLELHVVVEGRGIMSLEEDVVVRPEGNEYLSTPQLSLRYIHG